MIRRARPEDLPVLRDVERAAGALFRSLGIRAVAKDEPPSIEELTGYQQDGRALVATDEHDVAVGYLLVERVDGAGHVEQLSVDPAHGRQGLGRALVEAAATWAAAEGLEALTLTTYAEVAWNAPYYARLGFAVLAPEELSEGLRRIRAQESARGLDAWPRVSMRRALHRPEALADAADAGAGLTLVVVADVPPDAVAAFRAYEEQVLPLLAPHGGRLERRLRSRDGLSEVHVISFTSRDGYEAYLADPERARHRSTLTGVRVDQRVLDVIDVQDSRQPGRAATASTSTSWSG